MIEKILERLEEERKTAYRTHERFEQKVDLGRAFGVEKAIEIVQEVAKEYGNADLISRSVLLDKLQKWKFANEERGYDTASDLVQEMIDLVKEQASAPYQKDTKTTSRCINCTHYIADEVPPICYLCCKGIEDNFERREVTISVDIGDLVDSLEYGKKSTGKGR